MSAATKPTDKESLEVYKLLFDFGQKKGYFERIRISHFWTEKANIFIQFLQLYSFAFTANYESWPLRWQGMYSSSYLCLFALDISSIDYDIIKNSQSRLIYSGCWIVLTAFLGLFYLFVRFVLTISVLHRVEFQRIYFKIVHFFYLPIALGTLPAALCQYENCSISGQQLVISILTIIIVASYLIAYPVYLFVHVHKKVISTEASSYEEFIKLKEMEFLLGVSSSWLTEKLYLFSSYRSTFLRVYHGVVYYAFVLALVFIHALVNKNNEVKLLILLIISGVFSFYITIFPVYRCMSSSILYDFCMWLVTATFFIGFLKASGYQSQTMVDSNLVNIIVAVDAIGSAAILIILVLTAIFRLKWDVGVETVKQLAIAYRYLLDDLRNAQKMILTLKSLVNFHFVKIEPIEKMEDILVDHYKLLSKEKHPLQFTVMEQLDILTFLKEQVRDDTLLPSFKLERDYALLVRVVNRRWKEQILFNPIKRRILLKLGVLKLFLGGRETNPFNSGENGDFDKARKDPNDYYINKFYRDFEEIESSREGIVDTKYSKEDLKQAVRRRDIESLISITISQIDSGVKDMLAKTKKAWKKIGTDMMPENLYNQLFNDS